MTTSTAQQRDEGALERLESASFQTAAQATKFAIETSQGFWNRETGKFGPIEDSSTFNWLEQEDHLIEVMEQICITQGDWFKVVCVAPFDDNITQY